MKVAHLYVMSIGAFILAGAHYVRDGSDGPWYLAWCVLGSTLAMAGKYISRVDT